MAKKKLPSICRRAWLNKKEGTAYIYVHGEMEEGYGDYKEDRSFYGTFEIKDCNRQATIEFWYSNDKEYKDRLHKVARMKEEIAALEEFMLANPPVYVPRKKKKKEKEERVNKVPATCDIPGLGTVTTWVDKDDIPEGEELTTTTEAINDAQDAKPVIQATANLTPVSVKKAK